MYIRWQYRPRRRDQDTLCCAILVQGHRDAQGRVRTQVIGYLASLRACWRHAPAHRLAFWQRVEYRLAHLVADPLVRQTLTARLAQCVPPPTSDELETLHRKQTLLTAMAGCVHTSIT